MKKSKLSLISLLFLLSVLFFFTSSPAFAYSEYVEGEGTYVFGEIEGSTTWTANSGPYIIVGDVIIPEGETLTIEPGVEIKFDKYYELDVKGTLKAVGDKDNYITFTSNRDNPYLGSWRGIKVEETSINNEVQYTIIEYADTGIYSDSQGSISLKNSILRKLYNGVREIEDSEISYNDFLNIENIAFGWLYGSTKISHNYISGYQTVFHGLYDSNLLPIEYNNIDIGTANAWFIRYGSGNFENNYWGTDDESYIKEHIENPEDIDFEPYAESFITFDLIGPEDDVLFSTPSVSGIEFQWNPINGSGKDLDHYELYIDGEFTATTTETSYSYDISQLSNGFHQWYIKAVKNDNSIFQSNNILGFNINYRQPHTPVADPPGGWHSGDIAVTLFAENSDFITYTLTLDGSEPEDPLATTTQYVDGIQINAITDENIPAILKAKSWKEITGTEIIGSPLTTERYYFDLAPPAKPVANPAGGVYERGVSVELNSKGSVEVRYTTNGRDPTKLSDKYTSSIQINSSTVLKAKAWDEHENSSEIMEEVYFIKNAEGYYYRPEFDANLRASLEEGVYIFPSGSTEITLSANEETDVIRYTLDGSEVAEESTKYTEPITISTGTTTLRARAWAKNGAISERTINNEYIVYDHGTFITDDINADTTWNTSGSPYIIKRYTGVNINRKLTINPGVEVILNRDSGLYDAGGDYGAGKIEAIGTEENSVIFRCISTSPYFDGINLRAENNSKFEHVKFNKIYLSLFNSVVSNSVFDDSKLRAYSSKIENSRFINIEKTEAWDREIEIGNNITFSNNYVETEELRENMYIPEEGISAMLRIIGSNISIQRNEFVKGENSSDVRLFDIGYRYSSEQNYNNIDINKNNFNFILPDNILLVKNNSGMKVDMRNNYWGTTDESYIQNHIYDSNDNSNLGEVYYRSYADSPLTFDLIYPNGHTLNNSNINFQWEPINGSGSDLNHYEFYINDDKEADDITTTNYNYSGILEDGNYTWFVGAAKKDNSSIESNRRLNFTIDSSVDKVIAQPNGGTYIRPQTVSLSYPIENAIIRYTLDSTEPTEDSTIYTEPIKINSKGVTILKAIAWHDNIQSDLMEEEYNIEIDPPIISSAYAEKVDNSSVDLMIEIDRPASCRYSTEDVNFSSMDRGFVSAHGTPLSLVSHLYYLEDGLYKYYVICTDGVDESETVIEFKVGDVVTVVNPTASPEPGTYTSAQSISLFAPDANSIHYTLEEGGPESEEPTCTTGLVYYDSPILISEDTKIKAIACYGDLESSDVVSFEYVINEGGPTWPSEQVISLEPSWNIVSTPRVLLDYEFSVPETTDYLDIYVLDPTTPSGWATMQGIGQTKFEPLYAYFINNKTDSTQILKLNYDNNLSPEQRLFQRTLTTGWNAVGIALPNKVLSEGRRNKYSESTRKILDLVNESVILMIDFTADQENPDSVKVGDNWKAKPNLEPEDLDSLRKLKGYGVFVRETTDEYIGFQNIGEEKEEEGTINVGLNSNDNPNVGLIMVDKDSDAEDQTLLVFDVEAEDADVTLEEMYLDIISTTTPVTSVVKAVRLYDGDVLWASEVPDNAGNLAFNDLEIDIEEDATKTLVIKADFYDTNDGYRYPEGTVISVDLDEIRGEDRTLDKNDVVWNDSLTGNDQFLYVAAPVITFVDASIVGTTDKPAEADGIIQFAVTAMGDDIYIAEETVTGAGDGVGVLAGGDPPEGLADSIATYTSDADIGTNDAGYDYYIIAKGQTEGFEVSVHLNNDGGDADHYRAGVLAIVWTTDEDVLDDQVMRCGTGEVGPGLVTSRIYLANSN